MPSTERANPSSAVSVHSHAGTNGLASAGALLRPNHHPMLAPKEKGPRRDPYEIVLTFFPAAMFASGLKVSHAHDLPRCRMPERCVPQQLHRNCERNEDS